MSCYNSHSSVNINVHSIGIHRPCGLALYISNFTIPTWKTYHIENTQKHTHKDKIKRIRLTKNIERSHHSGNHIHSILFHISNHHFTSWELIHLHPSSICNIVYSPENIQKLTWNPKMEVHGRWVSSSFRGDFHMHQPLVLGGVSCKQHLKPIESFTSLNPKKFQPEAKLQEHFWPSSRVTSR